VATQKLCFDSINLEKLLIGMKGEYLSLSVQKQYKVLQERKKKFGVAFACN